MTETLEKLREAAEQVPAEQIPDLLGQLRTVEARLMQRLMQPPPAVVYQPDRLLNAKEAAPRLGCSEGYLYNNWRELEFSVETDYGPRFSERGIEQYIRARLTPEANNISETRTPNVHWSSKIVRKPR